MDRSLHQMNDHQTKINKIESEIAGIKAIIDEKSEIAGIKAIINEKESQIKELQSAALTSPEHKSSYLRRIEHLQGQIEHLQYLIGKLHGQIERLQGQILQLMIEKNRLAQKESGR